jgi:urea transport system permease protein
MDTAVFAGQLFNGISLASILLLAALGLALSFGVMNVINMAHGELLMAGGYISFMVGRVVHGRAALPCSLVAAFLGAAFLGGLLEFTVIRRLYGRPLDTLLATWGISLILQQGARSLFGAIGVEVTAPSWLSGSTAIGGVDLPHVRLFIIGLALLVLGLMALFIARSSWGLLLRAVHQNREMAEAHGVNTARVDLTVFALGSGIAGLAGSALALIAPVTPTVGSSYIVYAFLVVIVGGLGSLLGTVLAAVLVGVFSSSVQIFTSVSFADVMLLVMVVLFIQFRPKGIIYMRSRALEES